MDYRQTECSKPCILGLRITVSTVLEREFGCSSKSTHHFAAQLDIAMPEISRFLGIVIFMYFDEHNPPHFHVKYNEHAAVFNIRTLNVSEGHLPARVRGLVEEWAELHKQELLEMWETKEFHKIQPLV